MKCYKSQLGASFLNALTFLLVVGTVITFGTKMMPLYMDHNTMSTLMDKMAAENGMAGKSNRELLAAFKKRLKLNNIRKFDIKNNVVIERTPNGTDMKLDYEVRLPLVYNVDLIASFNKSVELRK
ncbi:MAG: DUF4845 domain-containing protein [Pseudomonadales bacterium]|nr:DUF4845 domain-containing protein [Pseudomonadales bacterium]